MPKWARAVPVNPSYEQQSTLPRQIRDKQQASEQKLLENEDLTTEIDGNL